MKLKVGHRHLPGQYQRHRAGKEAQEHERPADDLEHGAYPELRDQQYRPAGRWDAGRKGKELHAPRDEEDESRYDPQYALQPRGPGAPASGEGAADDGRGLDQPH
jgi:hypothetical protein